MDPQEMHAAHSASNRGASAEQKIGSESAACRSPRDVLFIEVCKPVGSIRAGLRSFFFYRSGSGSFSFAPFIVPIHAHGYSMKYWLYYRYYTSPICNAYTHALGYRWRLSMQRIRENLERGKLLKLPNASGKTAFWIIHAFDDDPDSPSPHYMHL